MSLANFRISLVYNSRLLISDPGFQVGGDFVEGGFECCRIIDIICFSAGGSGAVIEVCVVSSGFTIFYEIDPDIRAIGLPQFVACVGR